LKKWTEKELTILKDNLHLSNSELAELIGCSKPKFKHWTTITREVREAVLSVLEEEYNTRDNTGNSTLEKLFAKAITTKSVREAISNAIDTLS